MIMRSIAYAELQAGCMDNGLGDHVINGTINLMDGSTASPSAAPTIMPTPLNPEQCKKVVDELANITICQILELSLRY